MSADVIVCSGCCCGNLQKGYDEVPIDFLQDLWQKNQLQNNVKLTISGCLGSCSKRNVAVLKTDDSLIWLGGLSSQNITRLWLTGHLNTQKMIQTPKFLGA